MPNDLSRTRDRIAQALYVLGALASCAILAFSIVNVVFLIDELLNPRRYSRSGYAEGAIFGPPFAIAAYVFGWGLRWVINGTSTSVIDYLRDPEKIISNLFITVPLFVFLLFSSVLPLIGLTNTSGYFEEQFFKGISVSLAVLMLSCLGLFYKENRQHGFALAALAFSTLFIVSRFYPPF